ncbi:hypothetical protein [Virgibacillus alimentarius]|uniref:Uncharacterized membrane protein YcaP (DUF421 family) n=1 Tax=Virgibacillus alimentarius TaxID=698769 RepID=A0ABS4S8I4_9BACI|nr:hypothetical protein [Virgibacillus alimentarius]MBP2257807.1 uncharacterized membrane protein YcaP (DUF421 family) [Virgibacillus alimentarius]
MIENLLRFPLFQILLLTVLGTAILEHSYSEYFPLFIQSTDLKFMFFVVFLTWIILITVYNMKNPARKFNFFTLKPTELIEEDEGLKWMTLQACRKVYIYYSVAIPLGIGIIAYFSNIPFMPLLILILLGIGQYIIYWLELKKIIDTIK